MRRRRRRLSGSWSSVDSPDSDSPARLLTAFIDLQRTQRSTDAATVGQTISPSRVGVVFWRCLQKHTQNSQTIFDLQLRVHLSTLLKKHTRVLASV